MSQKVTQEADTFMGLSSPPFDDALFWACTRAVCWCPFTFEIVVQLLDALYIRTLMQLADAFLWFLFISDAFSRLSLPLAPSAILWFKAGYPLVMTVHLRDFRESNRCHFMGLSSVMLTDARLGARIQCLSLASFMGL